MKTFKISICPNNQPPFPAFLVFAESEQEAIKKAIKINQNKDEDFFAEEFSVPISEETVEGSQESFLYHKKQMQIIKQFLKTKNS